MPGGRKRNWQAEPVSRSGRCGCLSGAAATSPSTLVALERDEGGRLKTLERVLVVLGAGAYLAPRGRPKAFLPMPAIPRRTRRGRRRPRC